MKLVQDLNHMLDIQNLLQELHGVYMINICSLLEVEIEHSLNGEFVESLDDLYIQGIIIQRSNIKEFLIYNMHQVSCY